jgi:hypothetical protein
MKLNQNQSTLGIGLSLCLLGIAACSGTMQRNKPEQGLQGAFSTYSRPVQIDCAKLVMQSQRDTCRRQNETILDEPYTGSIEIRNLTTDEKHTVGLDPQGKYHFLLNVGQYEVCIAGSCSDPIEIRMGTFPIYGQRFPKAIEDKVPGVKPELESQVSDPK